MTTSQTSLDDLLVVSNRLADLMSRENEILRSMRPGDIKDLQKDKADLAQRYEQHMLAVQKDPAILASASPAMRAKLREHSARFDAVLVENERRLRAVRSVNERVMKVIVDAAAEQQLGSPAYSSAGVMGATSTGSGRRIVAVTFNKQL
jgi:hypothetical protein